MISNDDALRLAILLYEKLKVKGANTGNISIYFIQDVIEEFFNGGNDV